MLVVVVFVSVLMLVLLVLMLALVLSLCPAHLSFSISGRCIGADSFKQLPNDQWIQHPPLNRLIFLF
jgi:hypothetical protein